MAEKLTRREFAKGAAAAAAAIGLSRIASAQDPIPDPTDADLVNMERQLAEPLSAEVKTLARETLKANAQSARLRLSYKLPENSEPCFLYVSTPHPGRKP